MKYGSQLEKIAKRLYSRADLAKLLVNAEKRAKAGDLEAQIVLDAIHQASPMDAFVVFMGFCPGASMDNRLDREWRQTGVCTFIFLDSPQQLERFNSIGVGDLIVLKKRHQFGKTMQLFGHGRVTGTDYDPKGNRFLRMNWASQDKIIQVPLMGCNSTVDIRSVMQVEAEMPETFYTWLNETSSEQT